MNLLIIIEGNDPDKPAPSLFDKADKIWLLYLSPRVKALQYKEELLSDIKEEVGIEIINPKNLVDFYHSREILLNFIASLPGRLRVGDFTLSEYLNIQGLNMWWTSGIVEATPYKRDLFQNFYYLSAVQNTLEKFNIDTVWFQLEDLSLEKDLIAMLDKCRIKYYQRPKRIHHAKYLKTYALKAYGWLFSLLAQMVHSILFKLICPRWAKPQKPETGQKSIHLFYSTYPYNWRFKDHVPEHKIYLDLPSVLSQQLGGEAYFLSTLTLGSIFHPCQPVRDVRRFWAHGIRFIPMGVFLSPWDILRVFLSPVRRWKYFRLKRTNEYRELFNLDGIDMFHSFDQTMRDSLLKDEAREMLLYYHAFRKFARHYGKGIFQVVYYAEFHNWEVALIGGVRDGDKSIPIVGLQQSAPNPTLLSFFFSPTTFQIEGDSYPLPDLLLCSGRIYKELMHSNGIEPERVEVVGHIGGQYLKQPLISNELKQQKREEIDLPTHRKICLVACSINLSLNEGVIYLLKQVVNQLPEVLFLIKGHPDTHMKPLLGKYSMNELENIRSVDYPISVLLPLSDYFLSASTSVSQEALWQGLPQVNLDIGGLPQANPLHMVSGLIQDVETPDELMEFFMNTERFRISEEKRYQFLGDLGIDPYQKILEILVTRFHQDSYQ